MNRRNDFALTRQPVPTVLSRRSECNVRPLSPLLGQPQTQHSVFRSHGFSVTTVPVPELASVLGVVSRNHNQEAFMPVILWIGVPVLLVGGGLVFLFAR
jgi:hypothetical protein